MSATETLQKVFASAMFGSAPVLTPRASMRVKLKEAHDEHRDMIVKLKEAQSSGTALAASDAMSRLHYSTHNVRGLHIAYAFLGGKRLDSCERYLYPNKSPLSKASSQISAIAVARKELGFPSRHWVTGSKEDPTEEEQRFNRWIEETSTEAK